LDHFSFQTLAIALQPRVTDVWSLCLVGGCSLIATIWKSF